MTERDQEIDKLELRDFIQVDSNYLSMSDNDFNSFIDELTDNRLIFYSKRFEESLELVSKIVIGIKSTGLFDLSKEDLLLVRKLIETIYPVRCGCDSYHGFDCGCGRANGLLTDSLASIMGVLKKR